jgi:putative membrane protein
MKNVRYCLTAFVVRAGCVLVGLAGCADSTANQAALAVAPPPPVSLTAASVSIGEPETTLTDGQIVGIAAAVDEDEVAAGKLAESHAASEKARAFAQQMVSAHTDIQSKLISVADMQGIRTTESNLCRKLKSEDATAGDTLANMAGVQFDRAYLADQLRGHEQVVNLLDGTLIPNAQNPALRSALQEMRAKAIEHLRMAREATTAVGG